MSFVMFLLAKPTTCSSSTPINSYHINYLINSNSISSFYVPEKGKATAEEITQKRITVVYFILDRFESQLHFNHRGNAINIPCGNGVSDQLITNQLISNQLMTTVRLDKHLNQVIIK